MFSNYKLNGPFKFPKSDDWAPFCNIHRGLAKKMFEIEREIDAKIFVRIGKYSR